MLMLPDLDGLRVAFHCVTCGVFVACVEAGDESWPLAYSDSFSLAVLPPITLTVVSHVLMPLPLRFDAGTLLMFCLRICRVAVLTSAHEHVRRDVSLRDSLLRKLRNTITILCS